MSENNSASAASAAAAATSSSGSGTNKRQNAEKFVLTHQSYEDREFEGKSVLVPEAQVRHQKYRRSRRAPVIMFAEDVPDDYEDRMNLQVLDDAEEGNLFEDEVEEEFDEDFIRQMMTGEGVPGFEEGEDGDENDEDEDDDDDEGEIVLDEETGEYILKKKEKKKKDTRSYPKHEEHGATEKQFDKMMTEFDMDEDIQEDDPRTHGSLPVEQYGNALEQFIAEHAGSTMVTDADEPLRHKGLIQQLNIMARNNQGLAIPSKGLVPLEVTDRRTKGMEEFFQASAELGQNIVEELKKKLVNDSSISVGADVDQVIKAAMRPDGSIAPFEQIIAGIGGEESKKGLPVFVQEAIEAVERRSDRVDCETVLTTLTSTFNLPNVITTNKKLKVPRNKKAYEAASAAKNKKQQDGEEESDEDEYDDDNNMMYEDAEAMMDLETISMMRKEQRHTLSQRPTAETSEQKKARRALVKQMQREARAMKKELKQEFKTTTNQQSQRLEKSKSDKRQATLSSIRGNMQTS